MAQVLAFNKQSQQQIKDVHEAVKSAKTKMHPIALVVMCVAALFIVLAAGYTWWHNYELFSRGTSSKIVAAFPATLLDGSLVLLIPAAIWWFVSPLQRTIERRHEGLSSSRNLCFLPSRFGHLDFADSL